MRIDRKVNFSDILEKAILSDELSRGGGWHNVSIGPARMPAHHEQHGYYRSVVLPLAKAWLNETQGGDDEGEDFDEEGTHNWLKIHLRGRPVINKRTGEQIGMAAKSHADYSVGEMAQFITEVIELLKSCGVRVPPADKNYRDLKHAAAAAGKRN